MSDRVRSTRRYLPLGLLVRATAVAGLSLALLVPADAQFWGNWGNQRPQQRQQNNNNYNNNNNGGYNPFGGFLTPSVPQQRESRPAEREVDYSKAPSPPRKPDASVTTPIVVMGDAMADWLGYGLEDAFSEKPEIGVVRKHRSGSGLIRYEARRETEWAQVVRETITAEKPKFIVFMIGINDRQSIRERLPTAPAIPLGRNGAPAKPPTPAPAAAPAPAPTEAPPSEDPETTETIEPAPAVEAGRNAGGTVTYDFHSEKWEQAYVKRIDATIVALKSAGVPVFWVGLPAQRAGRASSDSAYLNDLYRSRTEKAGVTFVDVWDGFVDESGRFAAQGPDFEGQIRRLRTGDGVYFTKAGAIKLAHYVEREVSRSLGNQAVPVALPIEPATAPAAAATPGAKPNGPPPRPLVGPAVSLTATSGPAEDLIGGGRTAARASAPDPIAARVLTKGEPVSAPIGRADDFSWPRGNATPAAQPVVLPPDPEVETPAAAQSRSGAPVANEKPNSPRQAVGRQARSNADNDANDLRPPGSVGGGAQQSKRKQTNDAPPRSQSLFGGFGGFFGR